MSKHALYYYAANLPLIQRATFTTPAGKEYALGENGRDLLVFLCNAANEKTGWCFHMGNNYISEETDIHVSTVKRLMNGFEQLGWITRTGRLVRHGGRGAPTVEYALTFFPPCAENLRTGSPTSRPTSSPGATDNALEPLPQLEVSRKKETETEPQPEPKPEPEPKSERTDQAGAGKGEKVGELIALCVQRDLETRPPTGEAGAGLKRKLGNEYRPLVRRALEQYPNAPDTAVVDYCIGKRRQEPVSASLVATLRPDMANCEQCNGYGKVFIDMGEGGTLNLDCPTCNAPALSLTGT
jgi:hypothetical protein